MHFFVLGAKIPNTLPRFQILIKQAAENRPTVMLSGAKHLCICMKANAGVLLRQLTDQDDMLQLPFSSASKMSVRYDGNASRLGRK